MLTRLGRRLARDEGISLVEVLVSIMIVGITLLALASTLTTSMASARQNEGVTQATAIATEALEDLQALPWGMVGFYAGDPGYAPQANFDGTNLSTATLSGAVPNPRPNAPLPTRTEVRDGKPFTVTTEIGWRSFQRYLRLRVRVTWDDGTIPRTLTLEGQRARRSSDSGIGVLPADLFRIVSFSVNPDPLVVSSTGVSPAIATSPWNGGGLLIEISTNEPSSSVNVTWPGNSLALAPVSGTGNLQWRGVVPANRTYTHGPVLFDAVAVKSGAPTTQDTDQTILTVQYPIALRTVVADPNDDRGGAWGSINVPAGTNNLRICTTGYPRAPRATFDLSIAMDGLNGDDTVVLRRIDGMATAAQTWYLQVASTTPSGAVFTTRPAPGQQTPLSQWGEYPSNGNVTFQVSWTRSSDGTTSSLTGTVAAVNASGNSSCAS